MTILCLNLQTFACHLNNVLNNYIFKILIHFRINHWQCSKCSNATWINQQIIKSNSLTIFFRIDDHDKFATTERRWYWSWKALFNWDSAELHNGMDWGYSTRCIDASSKDKNFIFFLGMLFAIKHLHIFLDIAIYILYPLV